MACADPLIDACRPAAKVPPQHLRRAVPDELGPWWMAVQTFTRRSRLNVWDRLLAMVQEQGVQLGMTFPD